MTTDKFRALALSFPDAVESSHMSHPDFRIKGRIFATLGYPDDQHGMVKLTVSQQKRFTKEAPGAFAPCSGKWGQRGATSVLLRLAKTPIVRAAIKLAYCNIAPGPLIRRRGGV
jgi:hypothetical protein